MPHATLRINFAHPRWIAAGIVVLVMVALVASIESKDQSFAAVPLPESSQNNPAAPTPDEVYQMHEELMVSEQYPSARECGVCHPKHYEDWSVSAHAYAQLSPVFNAMHGKILKLTNGTNGDFCIRCHTQVGMNLNEPVYMSNMDRHPTSREGITCIVCHRVPQAFGKVSGRLPIDRAPLTGHVFGPTGDDTVVDEMVERGQMTTDPDAPGRQVHGEAKKFFQITTSAFCGTCHDVTLVNGFRLEEAFSEYKMAPAARKGISCQDCHMGVEQGVFLGEDNYPYGPAAVVGGVETPPRKLTDHLIAGPDYSVIHPALYPIHPRAIREEHEKDDPRAIGLATMREWLEFDYKAGWGTDEFEDNVSPDHEFPERWQAIDDRYDARDIIEENLALLDRAAEARKSLLRKGYVLGDVRILRTTDREVRFAVQFKNGTDGHNVPTGFDAERLVWLYVTVRDKDGNIVMQSGDLDPNGDVRDRHSQYVHDHELPLDDMLFSLQSKFITRNVRGGEREQILAVNYSADPLPFLRPERASSVLIGRPAGARKHKKTIEPLGERWPEYYFRGEHLSERGPYHVHIELKAAMVPVNLIFEIQDVGFDYNMSAREVADAVVAGHQVLWTKQLMIEME